MTTDTITRSDLIRKITPDKVTNQRASEVLEKTLEEIGKALAGGEEVKISSFGTFRIIHKKERRGRNPRTGEGAKISCRRVVSFRASPVLKNSVPDLSV